MKTIMTRTNEKMIMAKLTDFSGTIEIAVFPRVLESVKDLIYPDSCIAVKGRISRRGDLTSFIVEKAKAL